MHVVGDTQRVSRLLNTWNFKSQSYCIPIRVEELGHEDGSMQRLGEKYIYGTQLLNLSSFTEDKFEYIKLNSKFETTTDMVMPSTSELYGFLKAFFFFQIYI